MHRLAPSSRAALAPLLITDTERRFTLGGHSAAAGVARVALRSWESQLPPEVFYDLSLCVSALAIEATDRRVPTERRAVELAVRRTPTFVRAEIWGRLSPAAARSIGSGEHAELGAGVLARVADRWGLDRARGLLGWCEIDLLRERCLPALVA